MRSRYACLTTATLMLSLAGCGDVAKLPVASGYGPNPALPEPNKSLIPTVNIAEATGWPDGRRPQAAAGLEVRAFARDLDHPRWLYVLPSPRPDLVGKAIVPDYALGAHTAFSG